MNATIRILKYGRWTDFRTEVELNLHTEKDHLFHMYKEILLFMDVDDIEIELSRYVQYTEDGELIFSDTEAEEMEGLEIQLLAKLGFPNPYQ